MARRDCPLRKAHVAKVNRRWAWAGRTPGAANLQPLESLKHGPLELSGHGLGEMGSGLAGRQGREGGRAWGRVGSGPVPCWEQEPGVRGLPGARGREQEFPSAHRACGGQGRRGQGRRGQRRGCAASVLGAAGSPGAERKRGGPEPPGGRERLAPVPRPRERASALPGPRRARPRERASAQPVPAPAPLACQSRPPPRRQPESRPRRAGRTDVKLPYEY